MYTKRLITGSAMMLAVIVLTGCSKNPQAPGSISGSITYNGQPIKGGTMAFHTKEGTAFAAAIFDDGTYSATDIVEGELVVTVDTESIKGSTSPSSKSKDYDRRMKMLDQRKPSDEVGGGAGGVADQSKNYIKIPRKYANAKTSPLTVTVKAGRNVHNIELTD